MTDEQPVTDEPRVDEGAPLPAKPLLRPLPLAAVAVIVAAGLFGAGVLHTWRLGSFLVGVGFCFAAALRLTLPARQAGMLVVRSRGTDAAFLLLVGFGLVVLANTIPATT